MKSSKKDRELIAEVRSRIPRSIQVAVGGRDPLEIDVVTDQERGHLRDRREIQGEDTRPLPMVLVLDVDTDAGLLTGPTDRIGGGDTGPLARIAGIDTGTAGTSIRRRGGENTPAPLREGITRPITNIEETRMKEGLSTFIDFLCVSV